MRQVFKSIIFFFLLLCDKMQEKNLKSVCGWSIFFFDSTINFYQDFGSVELWIYKVKLFDNSFGFKQTFDKSSFNF